MAKALYLTQHFKTPAEIQFAITERPKPKIGKGQCLVQVHSSGINMSDALGAVGYFSHAKLPRIPGRDFAGVIVEGRPDLIGKKVWGTGGAMGLSFDGAHAEFLVIPEEAIAFIPKNLSLMQAGAQTLPYVTAYYSLMKRARVKAGEKVLVIGPLGQVGHAAMWLCFWKGCQPIGLVRGDDKVKQMAALGWPALTAIPQDLQVDVVLNTVGNVLWKESYGALRPFGRMVVIAAQEGKRQVDLNLFSLYRANQEIIGINTVDIDIVQNAHLLNELKDAFQEGKLLPINVEEDAIFPIDKAGKAYQKVLEASGKRIMLKIH